MTLTKQKGGSMKRVIPVLLALALAIGLLVSMAAVTMAASVAPTLIKGNPTAADAGYSEDCFWYKVDPPASGLYDDGTHTVEWTISSDGKCLSFSAEPGIAAVIVKGGPAANLYKYDSAVSDQGLISPLSRGGQVPAISHVVFVWREHPNT
ncbi:MAG: hypothetical protein NTU41_06780 [Chloroflexi bacterium]|nr:hypothetical protein [Chloroflexota bacterium]